MIIIHSRSPVHFHFNPSPQFFSRAKMDKRGVIYSKIQPPVSFGGGNSFTHKILIIVKNR
jgi:hypothetical protein